MLRLFIHYGIHFIVPVLIGFLFFKEHRTRIILILWAGIIIDVDHLFAEPIFDPDRCSIGFHPLHSYWAMAVYFGLLIFKKTRIFGLALLLHLFADATDCYLIDNDNLISMVHPAILTYPDTLKSLVGFFPILLVP